MKIQKPIVLVDLDGVTVDIEAAAKDYLEHHPFVKPADVYDLLDFEKMKPMKYAIESINYLNEFCSVYFCSTAPWEKPDAWTEKRLWVGNYFPNMKKNLILTHRKDLILGNYLIDDRTKNGAGSFSGELIQFGSDEFPDWRKILYYILDKENIVCQRCMQVVYTLSANQSLCKSCQNKLTI